MKEKTFIVEEYGEYGYQYLYVHNTDAIQYKNTFTFQNLS